MATRITIPIAVEGGASQTFVIAQTFDEVLGNVINPQGPPSSALEQRRRSIYTTTDGQRVYVPPQAVALVEEGVDA